MLPFNVFDNLPLIRVAPLRLHAINIAAKCEGSDCLQHWRLALQHRLEVGAVEQVEVIDDGRWIGSTVREFVVSKIDA